ncbi:MAG: PD-(D/E)XK nuclease family protein [Puniceicoccales bacterium]|nr:PD-(D/E)XK nuclease family protein [Puniceicoccales bacterium]
MLKSTPDTLIRFPDDNLSCEDIESIKKCTISYAARHDLSQSIHDYCFAIDPRLKLSCSSLEYVLQKPYAGFYNSVLKLPTMPWYSKLFDKKLALGSFTHEFLQIFEAKNIFIRKRSPDIFYGNIGARASRMKSMVARACAAADADVPADFSRTVDLATIWAKRLVDKLFTMPNWESFRSEYSLPSDLTVKIKDEEFCLSGRLDFIISSGNPYDANNSDADTVIIDFKTGSNVEMTERNVKWHMERYLGLQLLLYGIALKTLGFKTVGILILKPGSSIANTPIDVNYILKQVPELMEKLSQTIRTGLIERQVLGKTFRQLVVEDVPLATTDLY